MPYGNSLRNYSGIVAVCIASCPKKQHARNRLQLGYRLSPIFAVDPRAFAARRMARIFAKWFVNLLTSTAV
jgi:hypothetical protein